jgi:hypothetical protein
MRHHCSPSPCPAPSKRKRSPSPSHSEDADEKLRKKKPFQATPSTHTELKSVCPMCLGRRPHDVANCKAPLQWDELEPNRCSRTSKGHLRDPEGMVLCTDWQKPRGCHDNAPAHVPKHCCSGCGSAEHGTQKCPRAQKI